MACSGEGQECKDAGDVGSTQNCKSDETWCRKEERESPNGYFRSCTTPYFLKDGELDVDQTMKGNGYTIQALCVDVVSFFLTSLLVPINNLKKDRTLH